MNNSVNEAIHELCIKGSIGQPSVIMIVYLKHFKGKHQL